MDPLLIVFAAILVLVVGGISAVLVMNVQAQKKESVKRLIQGRASSSMKSESLEDQQNKRRAEIAKKLKENEGDESGNKKKKKNTLSIILGQAGLEINVKTYLVWSGVSGAGFLGLGFLLGSGFVFPILMFVIGFFGFPKFVLRFLIKKRQKNFLEEFPDALEAMVRLLKAGMPISESISMISREFTGPIGEEMTRIYQKQKIGVPLHEAALEATKRMPLPEVQMFATGLAIQAQTGSSLSEVLQNLSGVIRARFKLKRKIKALSSEAIASASIIGSLPVLLTLGMYFANREYIMILIETPIGNFWLGAAVFWMLTGCFVMKQMINFKI